METKVCKKCNIEKPIGEFYKNGKYYNSQCKQCKIKDNVNHAKGNKKIIDYHKKYREDKKEEIKDKQKEYYKNNYEYIKEYHKIYYEENKDKINKYREDNKDIIKRKAKEYYKNNYDKIKQNHKLWLKNNKIQQQEYEKNRMKNDIQFKLKKQVRNMIRQSFIRKGKKKEYKCETILGCTIQFFMEYLKNTFKDNYGYEWDGIEKVHIDHIIPLDIAKDEKQILGLCHYTNLQLLKEKDNIKKSNKLDFSKEVLM